MEQFLTVKKYPYFIAGILVFLGLYLTSLYHYLLFHSLAEIFSITIACGIFMIAWNSRQFFANNYLLFIGIAYLFVAGVDLIHTLAYKGMGVFEGYETNLATQLWIATRYGKPFTSNRPPVIQAKVEDQSHIFRIYSSYFHFIAIHFLLEYFPCLLH